MCTKHLEHLFFCGEEGDDGCNLFDDLFHPSKLANVLREQVKTMTCTWSPYNGGELGLNQAAHVAAI